MAERAEFSLNRVQSLVFGLGFLALAVVFALRLFPAGIPSLNGDTVFLLMVIAAFAAAGVWFLMRLGKGGVVLVVDREGLTDLRLMPHPIPWDEVERCHLTRTLTTQVLELLLRPDSQSARRLGGQRVVVNDMVLAGGGRAVRGAIAWLAPQVPRDW